MSVFSIFTKKEAEKMPEKIPRSAYLDDEAREYSITTRRLKAEERKMEHELRVQEHNIKMAQLRSDMKALLEATREDTAEGGASAGEAAFINAFSSLVMRNNGGGAAIPQNTPPEEQPESVELLPPEFSEAEIEGIIANYIPPKYRLLAKVLSEENIKRIILSLDETGILTEDSAVKIAKRLKE